jgi:hypothetical protein
MSCATATEGAVTAKTAAPASRVKRYDPARPEALKRMGCPLLNSIDHRRKSFASPDAFAGGFD